MSNRRPFSFIHSGLGPPPPELELPRELPSTKHVDFDDGTEDGATDTSPLVPPPSSPSMASKQPRPPMPLPPTNRAPLPPPSTATKGTIPQDSSFTDSPESSKLATIAPDVWEQVKEYQDQKTKYQDRIKALFEEKSKQFDQLFATYFEGVREAIKELQFSQDVQLEMLREEHVRVEQTKRKLFGATSLQVIEKKIQDKKGEIRMIDKVIKAQAVIRGHLQKRRFQTLYKPVRRRNMIVTEIVETEVSYVDNLETAIEVFYAPLKQKEGTTEEILNGAALNFLFGNLQIILNVNKQLLDHLKEQKKSWNSQKSTIGNVFVQFAPFFKIYTQYVNNYEMVLKKIDDERTKNSGFTQFLKAAMKNPKLKGRDLATFLIMPIQRIPRYELLLKELQAHTDKAHPDSKLLVKATERVHETAVAINEMKKLSEAMLKMLQLQNLMGSACPDLIQPHRRLLKEGSVDLVEKEKSKVECYIFLFNDALLVTQKNKSFMANSNLIFKQFAALNGAGVKSIADTWEFTNLFEISLPAKGSVLVFSTVDAKEREAWVGAIAESTSDFASRRLSVRSLTPMQASALSESLRSLGQSEIPTSPPPASQPMASAAAAAPATPTAQSQPAGSIEGVLEDAIALQEVLVNMPSDLRGLLVPHLKSTKFFEPQQLFEMKEKLAMLKNKHLTDDVLERLEASEVNKIVSAGKLAVTDLKNFVVASFPSQSKDPKDNAIRQLTLRLMKWFMALETLLASV